MKESIITNIEIEKTLIHIYNMQNSTQKKNEYDNFNVPNIIINTMLTSYTAVNKEINIDTNIDSNINAVLSDRAKLISTPKASKFIAGMPVDVSILTYFHISHENTINLKEFLPVDDLDKKWIKNIDWIEKYNYMKPYLFGRTKRERYSEYINSINHFLSNTKKFSITTENNLLPIFLLSEEEKPKNGILYETYKPIIEAQRINLTFSYERDDKNFVYKISNIIASICLLRGNFKVEAIDIRNLFLDMKTYINYLRDNPELKCIFTHITILFNSPDNGYELNKFVEDFSKDYLDSWYNKRADIEKKYFEGLKIYKKEFNKFQTTKNNKTYKRV